MAFSQARSHSSPLSHHSPQAVSKAQRKNIIQDPWADDAEMEASAPSSGTGDDIVTTQTGGGGAGAATLAHAPEGAGSEAGVGAGASSNDNDDFLVLQPKPGQKAKRPVSTTFQVSRLVLGHTFDTILT